MRKGFTLIELMIVIAIIAIIAAIAIPNLLESKMTANENRASAGLKSAIHAGQVGFVAGKYNDMDADNGGEFGHLGHLAGQIKCWGTTGANGMATGSLTFLPADYTTIDPAADTEAPTNEIGGYVYASYLGSASSATTVAGVNNAEKYFACATAPTTFDDTGRRGFCITQEGFVYSTAAVTSAWQNDPNQVILLCFTAIASATTNGNRTPLWPRLD